MCVVGTGSLSRRHHSGHGQRDDYLDSLHSVNGTAFITEALLVVVVLSSLAASLFLFITCLPDGQKGHKRARALHPSIANFLQMLRMSNSPKPSSR